DGLCYRLIVECRHLKRENPRRLDGLKQSFRQRFVILDPMQRSVRKDQVKAIGFVPGLNITDSPIRQSIASEVWRAFSIITVDESSPVIWAVGHRSRRTRVLFPGPHSRSMIAAGESRSILDARSIDGWVLSRS